MEGCTMLCGCAVKIHENHKVIIWPTGALCTPG